MNPSTKELLEKIKNQDASDPRTLLYSDDEVDRIALRFAREMCEEALKAYYTLQNGPEEEWLSTEADEIDFFTKQWLKENFE